MQSRLNVPPYHTPTAYGLRQPGASIQMRPTATLNKADTALRLSVGSASMVEQSTQQRGIANNVTRPVADAGCIDRRVVTPFQLHV